MKYHIHLSPDDVGKRLLFEGVPTLHDRQYQGARAVLALVEVTKERLVGKIIDETGLSQTAFGWAYTGNVASKASYRKPGKGDHVEWNKANAFFDNYQSAYADFMLSSTNWKLSLLPMSHRSKRALQDWLLR